MDWTHRLNRDEIADALAGDAVDERIAGCESCAAEFAEWKDLGGRLRQDLESRADLPRYFWARQQARIRQRLAPRAASMRWAAAAIFALILLASGLLKHGATPRTEITPSATQIQVTQAESDEALLQDIQISLQREVPAPLAPAAVLVEELASGSNQTRQVKEN